MSSCLPLFFLKKLTSKDNIVDLDGDTKGVECFPGINDILPSPLGSQKKTNQQPCTNIPPPKKRNVGTKEVLGNSMAKMA